MTPRAARPLGRRVAAVALIVGMATGAVSLAAPGSLAGQAAPTFDTNPPSQAASPAIGSSFGGTVVDINGAGFTGATSVRFGSATATVVRVNSDGEIHATSPPHPAGAVSITVTTPAGTTPASNLDRFTYTSDTWIPSAPTLDPRLASTATTLTDGRVLVAGGQDGPLGSAEVFDPAADDGAGRWSYTGSLSTPRYGHSATLLDGPRCRSAAPPAYCGRVLIAGGVTGFTNVHQQLPQTTAATSAELYDPADTSGGIRGTWSTTASMSVGRTLHSATLLDGPECHLSTAPSYCGMVLVAGGRIYSSAGLVTQQAPQYTPTAELYDPAGPSWTTVGTMNNGRWSHTATLLNVSPCGAVCGRVLVAGGQTMQFGITAINNAELYDPATQSWTRTDAFRVANRSQHTATVLPSGQVLGVGGFDGNGHPVASTELYDPVRQLWTPGATMGSSRGGHTATLLGGAICHGASPPARCGQVMVAGGIAEITKPQLISFATSSVELFDPSGSANGNAGSWTAGEPMTSAGANQLAAALADGRVVVAGGMTYDHPTGLTATTLYESPATVRAPSVTGVSPSIAGNSVILTGRGLAQATSVRVGTLTGTVTTSTYTRVEAMIPPQPHGAAVDVSVTTPLGTSPVTPATRFTYGAGSWTRTGSIDNCLYATVPAGYQRRGCASRYLHTATLLDPPGCHDGSAAPAYPCGSVLVAGGSPVMRSNNTVTISLDTAELYDPATGEWSLTGPLHTPKYCDSHGCGTFGQTATLLPDGRVLIAGGVQGYPANQSSAYVIATAEVYDPTAGTWTLLPDLTTPRFGATATLLGGPRCSGASRPGGCGKVLVTGGEGNSGAVATAELFDPASGTFTAAPSMGTARYLHTASVLPDGSILVAGGIDSSASGLSTAEVYDLASGTWHATGPLADTRYSHTATVLGGPACAGTSPAPYCGRVMVAGGMGSSGDAVSAIEVYDPRSGTWSTSASLAVRHANHTATQLTDGRVLIAGAAHSYDSDGPPANDSAELFDPAGNGGQGSVSEALSMPEARGIHTATLLDGPACRTASPAALCGSVLVAGGAGPDVPSAPELDCGCPLPPPLASAEVYTTSPVVTAVAPAGGPIAGGTTVAITGRGFLTGSTVSFGGVPAQSVHLVSPTSLTAVSPAGSAGEPAEVAVTNAHGTSADVNPAPATVFTYDGVAPPQRLSARTLSPSEIGLSWQPSARAGVYRVERSGDGRSGWTQVGSPTVTRLQDGGLAPRTRYFYRVIAHSAVFGDSLPSNVAAAVTEPPRAAPPAGGPVSANLPPPPPPASATLPLTVLRGAELVTRAARALPARVITVLIPPRPPAQQPLPLVVRRQAPAERLALAPGTTERVSSPVSTVLGVGVTTLASAGLWVRGRRTGYLRGLRDRRRLRRPPASTGHLI